MFIAAYDNYAGIGKTLEEAFEELCDISEASEDRKKPAFSAVIVPTMPHMENVEFYEATTIEVEFKVVKKEKPVKALTKHTL